MSNGIPHMIAAITYRCLIAFMQCKCVNVYRGLPCITWHFVLCRHGAHYVREWCATVPSKNKFHRSTSGHPQIKGFFLTKSVSLVRRYEIIHRCIVLVSRVWQTMKMITIPISRIKHGSCDYFTSFPPKVGCPNSWLPLKYITSKNNGATYRNCIGHTHLLYHLMTSPVFIKLEVPILFEQYVDCLFE